MAEQANFLSCEDFEAIVARSPEDFLPVEDNQDPSPPSLLLSNPQKPDSTATAEERLAWLLLCREDQLPGQSNLALFSDWPARDADAPPTRSFLASPNMQHKLLASQGGRGTGGARPKQVPGQPGVYLGQTYNKRCYEQHAFKSTRCDKHLVSTVHEHNILLTEEAARQWWAAHHPNQLVDFNLADKDVWKEVPFSATKPARFGVLAGRSLYQPLALLTLIYEKDFSIYQSKASRSASEGGDQSAPPAGSPSSKRARTVSQEVIGAAAPDMMQLAAGSSLAALQNTVLAPPPPPPVPPPAAGVAASSPVEVAAEVAAASPLGAVAALLAALPPATAAAAVQQLLAHAAAAAVPAASQAPPPLLPMAPLPAPVPDLAAIKATIRSGDVGGFAIMLKGLGGEWERYVQLQGDDRHGRSLLQLLLTPRCLLEADYYASDPAPQRHESGEHQLDMLRHMYHVLPDSILMCLMSQCNKTSHAAALHVAARHAAVRSSGQKMLELLLEHATLDMLVQTTKSAYLPLQTAARCGDVAAATSILRRAMQLVQQQGLQGEEVMVMVYELEDRHFRGEDGGGGGSGGGSGGGGGGGGGGLSGPAVLKQVATTLLGPTAAAHVAPPARKAINVAKVLSWVVHVRARAPIQQLVAGQAGVQVQPA